MSLRKKGGQRRKKRKGRRFPSSLSKATEYPDIIANHLVALLGRRLASRVPSLRKKEKEKEAEEQLVPEFPQKKKQNSKEDFNPDNGGGGGRRIGKKRAIVQQFSARR